MKIFSLSFIMFLCVCIGYGCTGHRTDAPPIPDGDTIEVNIEKQHQDVVNSINPDSETQPDVQKQNSAE